ncbi:unnamed protein product [Prunus armeniaca]
MAENFSTMISTSSYRIMTSYIIALVHILPNKMGVAERKNRHLLEVFRASLFGANMPQSFWGDVIIFVAYLTQSDSFKYLEFPNSFSNTSPPYLNTSDPKP